MNLGFSCAWQWLLPGQGAGPEQEVQKPEPLVQTAALAGVSWSAAQGISGSFQSAASVLEVGASMRSLQENILGFL